MNQAEEKDGYAIITENLEGLTESLEAYKAAMERAAEAFRQFKREFEALPGKLAAMDSDECKAKFNALAEVAQSRIDELNVILAAEGKEDG